VNTQRIDMVRSPLSRRQFCRAQAFPGQTQLVRMIAAAIREQGALLIDVIQHCMLQQPAGRQSFDYVANTMTGF